MEYRVVHFPYLNYLKWNLKKRPRYGPPDRRQAQEAPSHPYSNWTFIPRAITPLSLDKKVIHSSQWLIN